MYQVSKKKRTDLSVFNYVNLALINGYSRSKFSSIALAFVNIELVDNGVSRVELLNVENANLRQPPALKLWPFGLGKFEGPWNQKLK